MPTVLQRLLRPLFSPRFLRYGIVGGSGFVVNLVGLFILKDGLGVHQNVAYVLAVECAVLSNFFFNDRWTFKDRKEENTLGQRLRRFHLVSAVGMALNTIVFVIAILLLFSALSEPGALADYFAGDESGFARYIMRPIIAPPDVGFPWTYAAPVAGVAAAMLWNFFANFFWTWKAEEGSDQQ